MPHNSITTSVESERNGLLAFGEVIRKVFIHRCTAWQGHGQLRMMGFSDKKYDFSASWCGHSDRCWNDKLLFELAVDCRKKIVCIRGLSHAMKITVINESSVMVGQEVEEISLSMMSIVCWTSEWEEKASWSSE